MEKGFDTVWQNAIKGIGGMPPMGTCGDCSDDEIKAAIEHMIEGI
jgi:cytochrome c5